MKLRPYSENKLAVDVAALLFINQGSLIFYIYYFTICNIVHLLDAQITPNNKDVTFVILPDIYLLQLWLKKIKPQLEVIHCFFARICVFLHWFI